MLNNKVPQKNFNTRNEDSYLDTKEVLNFKKIGKIHKPLDSKKNTSALFNI